MKKHNYFAPAIEEVLMVVEQGIAATNGPVFEEEEDF